MYPSEVIQIVVKGHRFYFAQIKTNFYHYHYRLGNFVATVVILRRTRELGRERWERRKLRVLSGTQRAVVTVIFRRFIDFTENSSFSLASTPERKAVVAWSTVTAKFNETGTAEFPGKRV